MHMCVKKKGLCIISFFSSSFFEEEKSREYQKKKNQSPKGDQVLSENGPQANSKARILSSSERSFV